jgi:hypothetical protein
MIPKTFRIWDMDRGEHLSTPNVFWRFQDLVDPCKYPNIELHQAIGVKGQDLLETTIDASLGRSCNIFESDLILLRTLSDKEIAHFRENGRVPPDNLWQVVWNPLLFRFELKRGDNRYMTLPAALADMSGPPGVFSNPELKLSAKGHT